MVGEVLIFIALGMQLSESRRLAKRLARITRS